MSYKFEQLKKLWSSTGYNGLLLVPIRTNIRIGKGERHIITHRGVSFVWVNGNDKVYPFIFLPLKNYSSNSDLSSWDLKAYTQILEYLSLLSLIYRNTDLDINHESFKNYSSPSFDVIETQKAFYPKVKTDFFIEKIEFKTKNKLTDAENLILSLYRDGNSSTNIYHSYLSFFRIFEYLQKDESKKEDKWQNMEIWMCSKLSEIRKTMYMKLGGGLGDYDTFIDQFNKSGCHKIGTYLNRKCRDAVAHGNLGKSPIKSPGSFDDYYKMYYVNQFIKAAAFLIVTNEIHTEVIVGK